MNTYGIRGFPANCVCGTKTTIYTSETNKNPGRPFFRCLTRRKNHLFKWVEEAVYEEVQDALPKIVLLEAELNKEKSDIEDLKGVVTELMEEVVKGKTEVKSCKVMMTILFVIMWVIIIVLLVSLM